MKRLNILVKSVLKSGHRDPKAHPFAGKHPIRWHIKVVKNLNVVEPESVVFRYVGKPSFAALQATSAWKKKFPQGYTYTTEFDRKSVITQWVVQNDRLSDQLVVRHEALQRYYRPWLGDRPFTWICQKWFHTRVKIGKKKHWVYSLGGMNVGGSDWINYKNDTREQRGDLNVL